MDESARLPLPTSNPADKYQDCLCRACLHGLADQQRAASR